MEQCPFHAGSTSVQQRGEINDIDCPSCGTYRISTVALAQLAEKAQLAENTLPPEGWASRIARGGLISTRDTRQLMAS